MRFEHWWPALWVAVFVTNSGHINCIGYSSVGPLTHIWLKVFCLNPFCQCHTLKTPKWTWFLRRWVISMLFISPEFVSKVATRARAPPESDAIVLVVRRRWGWVSPHGPYGVWAKVSRIHWSSGANSPIAAATLVTVENFTLRKDVPPKTTVFRLRD